MARNSKLSNLLDKLISDAESLLKGPIWEGYITDDQGVRNFSNNLILFRTVAGKLVDPWQSSLHHAGDETFTASVQVPLAALQTVKYAFDEGLLVRFEDLIFAEAFADLTEQAAYLLSGGYFLAAGVILRAVLEERLRKLCDRNSCAPTKARPTINDYNMALYGAQPPVYDKNMMLQITALAAIGNDAAHNSPSLTKEDVQRLHTGIIDFLARFSA